MTNLMNDLPVSVVNTRKLLSQKPQAIKKRLSTVVMKQLERILTFWLKLSPKCRRAKNPLWLVTVALRNNKFIPIISKKKKMKRIFETYIERDP